MNHVKKSKQPGSRKRLLARFKRKYAGGTVHIDWYQNERGNHVLAVEDDASGCVFDMIETNTSSAAASIELLDSVCLSAGASSSVIPYRKSRQPGRRQVNVSTKHGWGRNRERLEDFVTTFFKADQVDTSMWPPSPCIQYVPTCEAVQLVSLRRPQTTSAETVVHPVTPGARHISPVTQSGPTPTDIPWYPAQHLWYMSDTT